MAVTLREQVLRGGAYMVIRHGAGVGIAFGGMLLLTRLIGPTAYGLYTTAAGIAFFFSQIARMGTDVYLVRREEIPSDMAYNQAFSLLLLSGAGLSVVGLLISPIVDRWLNNRDILAPLRTMLLLLPLTVLPVPAIARLERSLDYRNVAILETVELLLTYALALPLAWYHFGVWAPIAGYGASRIWLVIGGLAMTKYRPRWYWSSPLLRDMLHYGLGFSSSSWIWQLRMLAYPLIVGRYVGPEGVAYVALAIRMADGLNFVKQATWRLSLAALAKVQQDIPRLRGAMEEAMALQVLAGGPLMVSFALLAPVTFPLLFGDQWTSALLLFPFIALGDIVNALFSMHSSVLYVVRRNKEVALFHVIHIAFLITAALWLVPQLGLLGWGLAEVIALLSYFVLHMQVRRLFAFRYNRAVPWLLAFVPPLFTILTGWPGGLLLLMPAFVIPFSWTARTQVGEYWTYMRRSQA